MPVLCGFPKQERLRARREYLSISGRGQKVVSANFVIMWAASDHPHPRIGITVSRKVGGAVVRNRIKRFLREFYRQHKGLFSNVDYNFIARQGAGSLDMTGLSRELERILRRMQVRHAD